MKPTSITVDREGQTLAVQWADGHRSVWPLDGLRRACPCAGCMGGHANMGELPDPELFRQPPRRTWDPKVSAVGSYAIRITWDDGHEAGIYTWKRLRATCPCAVCSAAPGA